MNDRLIQIIALTVVAAALLAGVMLTPTINHQRRDRQLTYDLEVGDSTNPEYAFLASLGSLRGLAVHALWYRAEQLKQQGKFYEANNLAEMITKLQPRFPQVWLFQGWNMAYNISVKTNTPEERWDWVSKGMDLLRNPGIRNNPNSPTLYKELSWIFSHKMGGQTDDMNNYYKREFCKEWHILLGPPEPRLKRQYVGKTREQVLAEIGQDAFQRGDYIDYAPMSQERMAEIVSYGDRYLREPGADEGRYGTRFYYAALNRDARDRFLADYPDVAALVSYLESVKLPDGSDAGLGLNTPTLRAYGKIQMLEHAGHRMGDPRVGNIEVLGETGMALFEALKELPEGLRTVDNTPMLQMLRAQSLIVDYNMDPRFMLRCMDQFGELDWRHVHTHAVYWSALGTITFSTEAKVQDLTRIDLINTDRATIHAVQGLVHGGKIYFRPRVEPLAQATGEVLGGGIYDQQPNPDLIPAYGIALGFTRERIASGNYKVTSTNTYDQGWENFLQVALVFYYFGGNLDQAQQTWARLKEEFGDSDRSALAPDGEYNLSMSDFAYERLKDELGTQDEFLIRQMLRWALQRGVAANDMALTTRLIAAAKKNYDDVAAKREAAGEHVGLQGQGVQGRRSLSPWPEIVQLEMTNFLTNPGYPIFSRGNIWRVAGGVLMSQSEQVPLHMLVYFSMRPVIEAQIQAQQLTVVETNQQGAEVQRLARYDEVFSKPIGYDAWEARALEMQQRQPGPVAPQIDQN
ncbi:MAG: hypothetical protein AAGC44_04160 [Planctomycetota bacterium]